MKIAIDCADLDHSRVDGTRVYIKKLLDWFGKIDTKNQFLLYHRSDFNAQLKPKLYPNYIEKKISYKYWWTQTRFAYELLQDKPDVLWMPIQQLPYLMKNKIRTAVTIHDLAFKIFPNSFTRIDKFKLNLFTDFAIKNADNIIAVSQSTKNDVLRFYPKVDSKKLKVIYHGGGQIEGLATRKTVAQKNDKIQNRKFKIENLRYILYFGAIQPRKDLITLVEAFEILRQGNGGNLKLIIAGEAAWQADKILEKIKKSKFSKDIILTGKTTFKEAIDLYQNAEAFVFPSLYEGFGMPILEAWSVGVPVIVANNSSLEEIGAEAVLKFKTGDKKDLSEKIEKILKDDRLKKELIQKGLEGLNNFSWEKCAKETLAVITGK